MAEAAAVQAVLSDSFSRVRDQVVSATADLSLAESTYRPDPEANSVGWLVWHLSRVQDDHVAEIAGVDQVWPDWRERFGLPFDEFETGYGATSANVAAVRVPAELLAGYHAEVDALTRRYVDSLTLAELDRVVDDRWDPPVTVSVRLVSVIGDCVAHLGQAEYVRGLAQRAGIPVSG